MEAGSVWAIRTIRDGDNTKGWCSPPFRVEGGFGEGGSS